MSLACSNIAVATPLRRWGFDTTTLKMAGLVASGDPWTWRLWPVLSPENQDIAPIRRPDFVWTASTTCPPPYCRVVYFPPGPNCRGLRASWLLTTNLPNQC